MLIDWLISYAKKTPYFHLDGYMNRYFLLGARSPHRNDRNPNFDWMAKPASRFYRWLTKWVAIRLHHILRSDNDSHLHDHPFWFISIILRGGYSEVTEETLSEWIRNPSTKHSRLISVSGSVCLVSRWYGPGSILFRRAETMHRLIVPEGKTAWTLFIMGPKTQQWGVMTAEGKVPASEYFSRKSA